MGPKTSEIAAPVRSRIVTLHEKGESYREIARKVGFSFSAVRYVIKRFQATNSLGNEFRSGRPKKLNPTQERSIVRNLRKNPFRSAPSLADELASTSGITVHPETIRILLRSAGLHGRSPRKKPFISEVNRVKRLKFAKEYVNKPSSFWQTVIFSDESKFNLFGSDGRGYVWRKKNSELEAKNLLPTVKFGGGKVLVWGCMAAKGVGNLEFIEGNMTAQMYIDILRTNLKSSARKLGLQNSFRFQQDNDPKHTAHISREFLRINAPRQLVTPPQSPDMNPIENLWSLLEVAIRKRKISNKADLKRGLQTAWSEICPRVTAALVDSMPRRLQAIIDAKGMHTKY
ncbi:hypothetical protein V9T40_001250 [Parthenolecanium corni]|uniref:Transposase n=1 Tax=Parthenolecanium corni TaxID=536013 RepID=A0AAN9XZA3_9HEMI